VGGQGSGGYPREDSGGGMIVGDLFSGIGGFSLAAHWMGWRTAWFSEIDPFASRVLAHHWPDVPNLGDITKIDWATVAPVDVLTGGFPCQPHSLAGKRKASEDERDLFSEIIRAIRGLRPRYVVLENVRGLLTSESGRFFGRVLSELADCGYDAEWQVLSASDVGAPHRRERVWITATLAYGGGQHGAQPYSGALRSQQPASRRGDDPRRGADVGNADRGRHEQRDAHIWRDAVAGAGLDYVGDTGRDESRPGSGDAGEVRGLPSTERGPEDGAAVSRGADAGLGDARVTRLERLAGHGDARHEPRRIDTRPHGSVAASGCPVGWSDAVPVRGADGTVRRIPAEAAASGPKSPLWPVAHGVPARVAQLRGIGNSIVPACALEIFREIETRDAMTEAA